MLTCKPNAELSFIEGKVNMPDLNLMLPGTGVLKGTKREGDVKRKKW